MLALYLSDIYHTYLGLAALALSGGRDGLAELDPAINVSKVLLARLKKAIESLQSRSLVCSVENR